MGDVQIRLQNMDSGAFENDSAVLSGETAGDSAVETIPVPVSLTEAENAGEPSLQETTEEDTGAEVQEPGEPQTETESDDTLMAAMEAILFAMGEAVPVESIAQALYIPKSKAMEIADRLAERCRLQSSGVSLNWYEESVQLSTKPELYEYLIRIAAEPKKPKLTPTLLETLSIIAFRQPVTRMEVENIRGVNSDFAINRLVSYDLVEEVGRKEVPGRPLLFGTTQQFLRSFGIRSVEELPEPDSSHMEAFREEAEEEVSSRLDI